MKFIWKKIHMSLFDWCFPPFSGIFYHVTIIMVRGNLALQSAIPRLLKDLPTLALKETRMGWPRTLSVRIARLRGFWIIRQRSDANRLSYRGPQKHIAS